MTSKRRKLFGNIERVLSPPGPTDVAVEESPLAVQRRIFADFCKTLESRPIAKKANGATDRKVSSLSPRVRQTLERILVGDSEKQIARKLGVSQNTVHVYVKSIYRAFGVSSRGELMTHFVSERWLTASDKPHPSHASTVT